MLFQRAEHFKTSMHFMALQTSCNVSYEGNTRLRMKDWGILFPSLSLRPSETTVKLVCLWLNFPVCTKNPCWTRFILSQKSVILIRRYLGTQQQFKHHSLNCSNAALALLHWGRQGLRMGISSLMPARAQSPKLDYYLNRYKYLQYILSFNLPCLAAPTN